MRIAIRLVNGRLMVIVSDPSIASGNVYMPDRVTVTVDPIFGDVITDPEGLVYLQQPITA